MRRRRLGLKTKLSAALLALGDIPYEHAKKMTANQIISLYHFDHGILHGVEIINEPWNLTPRLIKPHREKSKRDCSTVAKVKRVSEKHEDFVRRVLAVEKIPRERRGRSIPSRPFPKVKRSFRSNGATL